MANYIESMLQELFEDALSNVPIVEHAHSSLGLRPRPGAPAWPIIAHLLNYWDRDMVLHLAGERQTLHYQGNVNLGCIYTSTPTTLLFYGWEMSVLLLAPQNEFLCFHYDVYLSNVRWVGWADLA
ncbi:hypothetical protein NDU88_003982 [Pleurodeles waltl]|uniref:Uncharacterized protein n=1 Tax=Pleurodeles waltl TaxID=8319 RepID=A0AAV7TR99_PLEWA|nr:hypothetical protein NDU88_003982 [Pleurodeles waltl]